MDDIWLQNDYSNDYTNDYKMQYKYMASGHKFKHIKIVRK